MHTPLLFTQHPWAALLLVLQCRMLELWRHWGKSYYIPHRPGFPLKRVHKMASYCVCEGNILLLFCLVIIEQSLLSFLSLFFWRKNFYILQLCMTTSTRRVGLLNWKAVQYFVLRKQQHRHTLFWSELTVTELRTLAESLSDQYVTYITSEYKCWRQGFILYRVRAFIKFQ